MARQKPDPIDLATALDTTRTGDLWLFRGPKLADRLVQVATNAPVNHVAMTVTLDDLPPLLWHSELGQGVDDVWSGERHRGAQLNMLADSVDRWRNRYRQKPYLRHLEATVTPEMEDQLLRVIARYNGRSFPRPRSMAWNWVSGRWRRQASEEALYCAELVAITYTRMGLLDSKNPANWYDPGRFWSGDRLELEGDARLEAEIEVSVEAAETPDGDGEIQPTSGRRRWRLSR